MGDLHDLIVLARRTHAYIAVCTCCGNISFMYQNIAITFDQEEFEYFFNYFKNMESNYDLEADDVFMSTPVKNIFFCFSISEIEEIKVLLTEATILLEAYRILNDDLIK